MSRIRKYTSTMPDTALPSPALSSGAAGPRMGTPANDTSWTGWAISSFTNKLASASGQIQAGANGSTQQRPSSVPPPATTKADKPSTGTSTPKHGMTLTKSAATIPTIASPDPAAAFNDEAEDFSGDWGGFEDDGFGTGTKPKEEEEDPWGTPTIAPSTTTTSFDDKGEPDFAGWLAAQSQTKKATKNPLPKGLAKSGGAAKTTRPVVGGRTGSAPSMTRKVVVPPKEIKKEEVKSKEDEEEGWGDAW